MERIQRVLGDDPVSGKAAPASAPAKPSAAPVVDEDAATIALSHDGAASGSKPRAGFAGPEPAPVPNSKAQSGSMAAVATPVEASKPAPSAAAPAKPSRMRGIVIGLAAALVLGGVALFALRTRGPEAAGHAPAVATIAPAPAVVVTAAPSVTASAAPVETASAAPIEAPSAAPAASVGAPTVSAVAPRPTAATKAPAPKKR
ncbi:MAG: hypothetical protein QM820_28180 [Minicystis sp.]